MDPRVKPAGDSGEQESAEPIRTRTALESWESAMSTTETPAKPAPAKPAPSKPAGSAPEAGKAEGKREKRTITEIRESKRTGEKMVYISVPDYTSAQWAEM